MTQPIIGMTGSSPDEANALAKSVRQQENDINSPTGVVQAIAKGGRRLLRLLFLGSKKGISVHQAMPDSKAMQSLEWMDWWFVKMVAAQYGVQPIYINAPSQGPGGYF